MAYQISYQCVECEQPSYFDSLELFEKHVWAYHLNDFPYHCAICGLPALSIAALDEHFNQQHDPIIPVEYKRKVEQENRLKCMTAKSIVIIEISSNNFEAELQHSPHINNPEETHQISDISKNVFIDNVVDPTPDCNSTILYDNAYAENNFENEGNEVLNGKSQNFKANESEDIYEHLGEISNSQFSEYSNENMPHMENHWVEEKDNNGVYESMEGFSYVVNLDNMVGYEQVDESEASYLSHDFKNRLFYKCDICGKKLQYISKMIEHRRSHTGEKPFDCKLCDKSFTQRGALRCHERLHTGERPFPCTWECGRSFVSSSARVMHEKSHAGIRSFSCRFCGQLFVKKCHVERHEGTRHKDMINLPEETGLDAAGEHLESIMNAVTDVVESVQKSKRPKVNRQPIKIVYNLK